MNTIKNTLLVAAALFAASAISAPATQSPATQSSASPTSASAAAMKDLATTGAFKGVEVNGGKATLFTQNGRTKIRVSDDFKLPASPAPHWQIVDMQGNVFLLNQFRIAGDKSNREITLPKHITSVAKVQVWCSFAEVLLGEASFAKAIKLPSASS